MLFFNCIIICLNILNEFIIKMHEKVLLETFKDLLSKCASNVYCFKVYFFFDSFK